MIIGRTPEADRPIITIDLDGVVCAPLFGLNLGIHDTFLDPDVPPPTARVWPRWLGAPLDPLRFDARRPLKDAKEALHRIAIHRTVVLLTGRRSAPSYWLRWYSLAEFYDDVVVNEGDLKSPHHKLEQVRRLGAVEHIDDDARTAQLLAEEAGSTVYLRDWPRNRGVHLHERVRRVPNLGAVADHIEATTNDPA